MGAVGKISLVPFGNGLLQRFGGSLCHIHHVFNFKQLVNQPHPNSLLCARSFSLSTKLNPHRRYSTFAVDSFHHLSSCTVKMCRTRTTFSALTGPQFLNATMKNSQVIKQEKMQLHTGSKKPIHKPQMRFQPLIKGGSPLISKFKKPLVSSSPPKLLHGWEGKSNDKPDEKLMKLMDMEEITWPNPAHKVKNWLMERLIIGYFEDSFNSKLFLEGAEQAVILMANKIADGQFDDLDGLVDANIIPEIRRNWAGLSDEQKDYLRVKPEQLYYRFIYQIGLMFDDETDKRYVEIMTVFQGVKDLQDMKKDHAYEYFEEVVDNPRSMYVANYRFFREFTKGVNDDWTVNALNHFLPYQLVQRYPYGK